VIKFNEHATPAVPSSLVARVTDVMKKMLLQARELCREERKDEEAVNAIALDVAQSVKVVLNLVKSAKVSGVAAAPAGKSAVANGAAADGNGATFICSICSKAYYSQQDLNTHTALRHADADAVSAAKPAAATADEKARKLKAADDKLKALREADDKAKRDAEEKAKREADDKAKREADERSRRDREQRERTQELKATREREQREAAEKESVAAATANKTSNAKAVSTGAAKKPAAANAVPDVDLGSLDDMMGDIMVNMCACVIG
jgi:hypothetical protein